MGKLGLIWGLAKVLAPERAVAAIYGRALPEVDGRRIDPKAQAASDLVAMIRDGAAMPSVAESRAQLDTLATKFDRPCPAQVSVTETTLPGLTGDRPARIYLPSAGDPKAAQPTLFFLHGGGWVQGSLDSHHGLCGRLAKASGLRVISYDYALAPEHRFPAAPDDVLAAYRGLLSGAGDVVAMADQLIVGGDSAGANLTAALMHDLRAQGDPLPRGQLLIYPAVDGTRASRSMTVLADQPLLPKTRIDWFFEQYLPAGQDLRDPRFSPLYSQHLAGQPPALILAAGHDPLWDDGKAYAEALKSAGVTVRFLPYEGQVHGFMSLSKVIPQGVDAEARIAAWLSETLR